MSMQNLRAAFALPLLALASLAACKESAPSASPAPAATPGAPSAAAAGSGIPQGPGDLYATFVTGEGSIVIKLFEKDAPKTVANFVGLATGSREWTDPRTGQKSHARLYDGTVFHRVIPNFMIQGGDPLGTGTGDPGYRFEDEFQSGRTFARPGLLAMANAGPGTNGSQFFITEVPVEYLNGKHTIFGEVVKGFEIVPKIARTPGKVALSHVEITRAAAVP